MSEQDWQTRITRREQVPPAELTANPANWRTHPPTQVEAAEAVLETAGWVRDVLVNENTGHIVDGHLRVHVALKNNQATVPVTYLNLSAAEEALALATFDPIGEMAMADGGKLAALKAKMARNPILDAMLERAASTAGTFDDPMTAKVWDREAHMTSFLTTDLRQIMVPLSMVEYNTVMPAIAAIRENHNLDHNTDALVWLLEQDGHGTPPTAQEGESE